MIKLKSKYCNHDWIKDEMIRGYIDYCGFRVGVFACHCSKCGKKKNRKYY